MKPSPPQFAAAILLCMMICMVTDIHCQTQDNRTKFGFVCAFGVKSFSVQSNIEAINSLNVMTEGGSAGVVVGNNGLMLRAEVAGFFYSSSSTPQSINQQTSKLALNVYPLSLLDKKRKRSLQPYFSVGADYSKFKFYGHYLQEKGSPLVNYSASEAPYLGSIRQISCLASVGLEYRIPETNFISVFAEVAQSRSINRHADSSFDKTSPTAINSVNIGVAFGSLR